MWWPICSVAMATCHPWPGLDWGQFGGLGANWGGITGVGRNYRSGEELQEWGGITGVPSGEELQEWGEITGVSGGEELQSAQWGGITGMPCGEVSEGKIEEKDQKQWRNEEDPRGRSKIWISQELEAWNDEEEGEETKILRRWRGIEEIEDNGGD